MANKTQKAWMVNGVFSLEPGSIPVTDDGLIRGDGAFEVFRTYGGAPFALDQHLQRLERSTDALGLEYDAEALKAELAAFVPRMTGSDRFVRFIVTRAGNRIIAEEPLLDLPPSVRLAVEIHVQPPLLAGVKSLSYAANMLASRRARARGYHEALLVEPDGAVLEGPTASVLWCIDGQLYATPLDRGVLDSITRRAVFAIANGQEAEISVDDLARVDCVLLAGTGVEVLPVTEIENVGRWDAGNPWIKELQEALSAYIAADIRQDSAVLP